MLACYLFFLFLSKRVVVHSCLFIYLFISRRVDGKSTPRPNDEGQIPSQSSRDLRIEEHYTKTRRVAHPLVLPFPFYQVFCLYFLSLSFSLKNSLSSTFVALYVSHCNDRACRDDIFLFICYQYFYHFLLFI